LTKPTDRCRDNVIEWTEKCKTSDPFNISLIVAKRKTSSGLRVLGTAGEIFGVRRVQEKKADLE